MRNLLKSATPLRASHQSLRATSSTKPRRYHVLAHGEPSPRGFLHLGNLEESFPCSLIEPTGKIPGVSLPEENPRLGHKPRVRENEPIILLHFRRTSVVVHVEPIGPLV